MADDWKAVRVVSVQSGAVRTVLRGEVIPGFSNYGHLCWSRVDGMLWVCSLDPNNTWTTELFRVNPVTGHVRRVIDTSGEDFHYNFPAESPDGREIAVLKGQKTRAHEFDLGLADFQFRDKRTESPGRDSSRFCDCRAGHPMVRASSTRLTAGADLLTSSVST